MARRTVDAIVIGAGAAGLAAARQFSRSGLTAIVLEARDRIGGRIFTIHDDNSPVPVELGAEFVHGEPASTLEIVRAARLMLDELPDNHLRSEKGRLLPVDGFWEQMEQMQKDITRVLRRRKADFSLSEYLQRSKLRPEARQMLINFVQGFEAAYPDKISAQSLVPNGGDDSDSKQFRIANGYDGVMKWLRAALAPDQIELRLNTIATGIRWKRGEVIVECSSRAGAELEPFRAKAAVITVPNALLRANAIRFVPELPEKERSVNKIEVGQIFKIVLRFRECFWEKDDFLAKRFHKRGSAPDSLSFVHCETEDIPVWWTAVPVHAPVITGWAGGPKADLLLAENEITRVDRTLISLSRVLAVKRKMLDELLHTWAHHDWKSDPFSRGAYSYIGVGGYSAPKALARPIQGTLFFAGEANDVNEMGTVGAAMAEGKRASREVAKALAE